MYYFRHLLNKFLRYKICTLTHPSLRINILNSSTSEAIIMCTSFAQSHGSHLRMHALHCSNFYCRRHQLQKSIKYKTKKKKSKQVARAARNPLRSRSRHLFMPYDSDWWPLPKYKCQNITRQLKVDLLPPPTKPFSLLSISRGKAQKLAASCASPPSRPKVGKRVHGIATIKSGPESVVNRRNSRTGCQLNLGCQMRDTRSSKLSTQEQDAEKKRITEENRGRESRGN